MKQRLRTSKKVDLYLEEMHRSIKLSSKASLARIAIGYSLFIDKHDPTLQSEYEIQDTINGFEFQRHTLLGDHDREIYVMVEEHANRSLTEDDFYPKYVNAHIERGIKLLYSEFQYLGKEKFISFLLEVNQ